MTPTQQTAGCAKVCAGHVSVHGLAPAVTGEQG